MNRTHPLHLIPLLLGAFALTVSSSVAAPNSTVLDLGVGSGYGYRQDCSDLVRIEATTPWGPRHRFVARMDSDDAEVENRLLFPPLRQMETLKIGAYNLLNLTSKEGRYVENGKKGKVWEKGQLNKSMRQIEGLFRNLRHERPDIWIGSEIQSLDAMMQVNRDWLRNHYFLILLPGNDEKRQIGFFVRNGLELDIDVQSFRDVEHLYAGETKKLFSRDFPVAEFRLHGSPRDSDPLFIYGGVHLKSMRSEEIDPLSVRKRTEQVEGMIRILKEHYEKKYGDRVPVLIGGDFNADLQKAEEFKQLRESRYRDVFDVVGLPTGDNRRITHTYFETLEDGRTRPDYKQVDGVFIDQASAEKGLIRKAYVVSDISETGGLHRLPRNFQERKKLPSDHRMVSVQLDVKKLLQFSEKERKQ
jgi:hypothetical protein